MSTKEKLLEELLQKEQTVKQSEIVLFNDDVNTFEHVIDTLIDVCEHTPEQAEQCSLIVHYNGKCTVKTGEYNDLKPRCSRLLHVNSLPGWGSCSSHKLHVPGLGRITHFHTFYPAEAHTVFMAIPQYANYFHLPVQFIWCKLARV